MTSRRPRPSTAALVLAIASSNLGAAAAFRPTPGIAAARANTKLRASLKTPTEELIEKRTTSSSTIRPVPLSHASHHHHRDRAAVPSAIIVPTDDPSSPSHVLSVDEMGPRLTFEKNGKTKVLNATGLLHLVVILLTMPVWVASLEALHWLGSNVEGFDENRAKFDYAGKVWCRAYLAMTGCYPEIAGDVSRLKEGGNGDGGGACLFVANHASFLDIAVLCCVLDPVFKFIAKDSLNKFPGVGRQLVGGEHVLIDRDTKRSQLRAFKQAVSYLQNGVPIMAFPEGARSPDGRLMPFKGGTFSMAVKAGVPIVPLSLANTHAVMPGVGFLPVQGGEGKLRVYVHDAVSVEGKGEEEIAREVRKALLSELPWDQHPLEGGGGDEM
mmetsp:Transcript_51595/g.109727  ORF Transcript_51595/g.109727 Transcript_51595/m.109727 type:complete len:383 (-) Transcript_51595:219-1367(-)